MLLLLTPAIQSIFAIFEEGKLKGSFKKVKKTELTISNLYTGKYQDKFSPWLEQKKGFRPFFVRLYNQYRFSLFKEVGAKNTFIGKDNVLFQTSYLRSYKGADFIGEKKVLKVSEKLKRIQDTLAAYNKLITFVIAPGKVHIYPEYLPGVEKCYTSQITNYSAFKNSFDSLGINYIDFNSYLMQIKDTSRVPLFPKGGTHWSGNTVVHVADSIFKYLSNKSGVSFPEYEIGEGYWTKDNFKYTDRDIEKALNLLFKLKAWDLYYPNFEIKVDTSKKPDLLIIGDSFYQSFQGFDSLLTRVFSKDSRARFYNKTEGWPGQKGDRKAFRRKSQFAEALKYDFIVIVSTESNLTDPGFGYIDKLYRSIYDKDKEFEKVKELRIKYVIKKIKKDKKWLQSVKKKAKRKNVSLEKQLRADAIWVVNKEYKKSKIKKE
jgi:hypothetical protein